MAMDLSFIPACLTPLILGHISKDGGRGSEVICKVMVFTGRMMFLIELALRKSSKEGTFPSCSLLQYHSKTNSTSQVLGIMSVDIESSA